MLWVPIQITVYSIYFENSEYTLTKLKKLNFSKASRFCFRNLTTSQKMWTFFLNINILLRRPESQKLLFAYFLEYNLVKRVKRHHVKLSLYPNSGLYTVKSNKNLESDKEQKIYFQQHRRNTLTNPPNFNYWKVIKILAKICY